MCACYIYNKRCMVIIQISILYPTILISISIGKMPPKKTAASNAVSKIVSSSAVVVVAPSTTTSSQAASSESRSKRARADNTAELNCSHHNCADLKRCEKESDKILHLCRCGHRKILRNCWINSHTCGHDDCTPCRW